MLSQFMVLPLIFSFIFVVHGASYKVFDTEGKFKKIFRGCGKLFSRALFFLIVWYIFPLNDYWSSMFAGIAVFGFFAGMGKYAEIHNGEDFDLKREHSLDPIVDFLRKRFGIIKDTLGHARLFLAVKGLVMGHVLYLIPWEVKRQLTLYTDAGNERAHFVQEALNGFLYGVILWFLI